MLLRRLHELLEGDSRAARWLAAAITTLILLNVAALIVDSLPELDPRWRRPLAWLEELSVFVFSLEYVLRLAACTVDPRYRRPLLGRIRYALTPLAIFDLLAVLPWYLPGDVLDLRVLRSMRLLRLIKLGRYSIALQSLSHVVHAKRFELLSLLGLLALMLVVASAVVFHLEHEAQPERFSSIPAAMWWAIVTLTTVGYGDLAPVTAGGRIVAAFVAMLGIAIIALPTGILAAGYSDEVARRRRQHEAQHGQACPHCGRAYGATGSMPG
jgi:voltage-gated potassium channel